MVWAVPLLRECPDTKYHYWEYFPDGSFNYYYQDGEDRWIRKSDNEGGYFLYGNLLVTNYTNDILSGGTGKAFECWNFKVSGEKMTWTGLRDGNTTTTYQMVKVGSAPENYPPIKNIDEHGFKGQIDRGHGLSVLFGTNGVDALLLAGMRVPRFDGGFRCGVQPWYLPEHSLNWQ